MRATAISGGSETDTPLEDLAMSEPPSDPNRGDDLAERQGEVPTWKPELMDELLELVHLSSGSDADFDDGLEQLEERHGESVFSEALYMLSHLRFDGSEAKRHWRRIREHRSAMQDRLGSSVDMLVAMVSYFVEIERKLEHPKVIELRLFEQTQASAYRDELTGLCNFRLFREHLAHELVLAERYGAPLSLVMVDIDDFKNYNDLNGHEAGNEVLGDVARLLADSLRRSDIPARYGGEEFVLVLPETTKTNAELVAERARRAIEQHPFPNRERQPGRALTVSMGVATYPADGLDPRELVRHADQAMYVAKSKGKNRVYLYGEDRRSFSRIEARLDGRFCQLHPDFHELQTVNISEQGLLFLVDQRLSLGTLIDVQLTLPDSDREVACTGRVVRVEEKRGGRYQAALRIVEIGTRDRSRLAKYIQEAQKTTTRS
jgi:diguanylate cyclase (GGDEF)-like protein